METSEGSQRKNGSFYHRTTDVSRWMEGEIKKAVEKKGYTIVSSSVESEIMTRMSRIAVLNCVSIKFKDGDEEVYALENYSSVSQEYDCPKGVRWLVDAIKELETQAVLKFAGGTMGITAVDEAGSVNIPSVNIKEAESAEGSSLTHVTWFGTTPEELKEFMTERERINAWTFGAAKLKGSGKVESDSFELSGGQFSEYSAADDGVRFTFKFKDWKAPVSGRVQMEKVGHETKATLVMAGVPIFSMDAVRRFWDEKVCQPISLGFRVTVRAA